MCQVPGLVRKKETTPVEATVATAMAAYFAERRKAGKSTIFAEKRYAHDIAPALGNVRLSDLTTDRLKIGSTASPIAPAMRAASVAGSQSPSPPCPRKMPSARGKIQQ